jgi:uncharacterized repeat protein (TIGR01451 family)
MQSENTLREFMSVLIRVPKTLARVALLAILALTGTASALTINLTFDTDAVFMNAGLTAADIVNMKAACNFAALQFTTNYTDPINVNIFVTAVPGTGTLGMSTTFLTSTTFANMTAKVIADATTADDATATGSGGSVPAVDPVSGSHTYFVSRAQAKALAISPDDLNNDGTYTFGGGFTYTYDPNNRAVPGAFDFIGVTMHEYSEIMGRIGLMGFDVGNGTPDYMLFDLFHYTGAGVRGLNNGPGRFFSIDNGTTLLKAFNDASTNGGDLQDWASGTNDSFNAFSSSGVQNDLTSVDLRNMDVIGYDLIVADLAITKTDSPDPVIAGNALTYTVTVTNDGPDTATSVTVTDNLPAETTFVSCSSTGGGVCGGSGNNRTVTFASLALGESETITFVATVNCSVADDTMISNTATVSSSTFDPNLNNNSATATTTASNPPPTITGASANPSVLWPPNHRMVNVTVSYAVTDNCPLPPNSCTLDVTSNESIGHTSPDWIVLDAHHVQLRAEREGNGNGRIYTITVSYPDSGGSSSSQNMEVRVPHDRGRR